MAAEVVAQHRAKLHVVVDEKKGLHAGVFLFLPRLRRFGGPQTPEM
jgi:hypothetical protein